MKHEAVDYDPFRCGEIAGISPTTEAQREIIVSARMSDEANLAFNESSRLRITGEIETDRLHKAVCDVTNRHDALHVVITGRGDEMCLLKEHRTPVEILDLQDLAADVRENQLDSICQKFATTPIDLQEGPLFWAIVAVLDTDEHELMLFAHHVIGDGWSFAVIEEEIVELYNQPESGAELPAAPSFIDYAQLSAFDSGDDVDFWVEQFETLPPPLDLPLDKYREPIRRFSAGRIDSIISDAVVGEVAILAKQLHCSVVTVMMTAFTVLLHRLSGNNDIVVGLPLAGQAKSGLGGLVGHCVQTLPIRSQLSHETSFSELAQSIRGKILDASEHSDFTFGTLVQKVAADYDRSRVPLVSVLFNIDQASDLYQFGSAECTVSGVARVAENFELSLNVVPSSGGMTIETMYADSIYSEATVCSWLEMFKHILGSASRDPDESLSRLDIGDIGGTYEGLNATDCEYNKDEFLSLVTGSAAEPDSLAVVSGAERLSYETLGQRVDQLASYLATEHGVGPGSIVGLYLLREADLLTAMLAVAKTGAAYLPLDPGFPEARLAFMVEDTDAQLVICNTDLPESMGRTQVDLRTDWPQIEAAAATDGFTSKADPDGVAYIIYTSGSTGKPKGVAVGHRALANFLQTMAQQPGLVKGDRLLAVTTLSFDISMLELLLPLTVGATVVVATKDESAGGQRLMELMDEHNINVMQATPATWRMLLGFGWEGKGDLKALCGGEALPPDLVGSLLPKVGELWNMYGPTETTIWSACKRIEDAAELITIGKPIANTQLYILNDALQLQPVGVPGELYIGGDGVAEGYHNRAELTAERFIEHPEFGRIYCTGDRARVMGHGEVQHLGRLDDQIKLRGYRIELGEIEAALAAVAGVSQAAAVVRQLGPGDERLVAFCVCDSEQTLDASEMRQALQNRLPDYMIPQHFIALDKLPVTPNNKLDRKALANRTEEIESSLAVGSVVDAGPMTPVEATVVQIFSEQLGDIAVGLDDDFFRLGGHSLTATWVIHAIEQKCNTKVNLGEFFTHPTARSVARLVSEQGGQADAEVLTGTLERLDPATPASLSPTQHRMWLVSQIFPDATFYNLPSTFRLRGELDVKVLQDSFQLLIDRQPALRTRFVVEENSVLQLIGEVSEAPALELVDMTGESDPVTTVLDWVKRQIATPFDLEAEWPYRCRLFRLGDNDHALYFMPHHIVFDGWSFDVFYGELNTIYQARMSGVEPVLPVHAYEYRDYCHWKNEANSGAAGQAMVDRWRERLSPMPDMLEIPRDFVPDPEADPAKLSALPIRIEADEMTVLRAACEREGITPFMMILAAYACTLARWTSTSELVIGTPMSGRDAPGSRDLVGLFVGALPLKIGIGGQASVRDLFEEVKRVCMEAFDDPDVPIEELVRELKLTRHVDRNPIFQVFFAFQDARGRKGRLGEIPLERINPGEDSTETDLEFWVRDSATGLDGAFQYRRAYFDPRHMEGFRDTFLETLKQMTADTQKLLPDLVQLSNTDISFYQELNTTTQDYRADNLISLVSDSGADKDAIAVVSGADSLSYDSLGQRVDQLASYLATEHGVGPGSIVGLYLLREADLLTAMLAVAKTGAAYLPLDPGFPEARLAFMVEDTDAQLVICNTDLPESMGRTQVDLRTDWPQIEAAAATDGFTSKADPDGVAYIIYTSGSTGKPKGVAVGHRALANFLQTMAQQPGVAGGDRLLAVTTLSFDISMLELLLPLTVAATVVVATQEESDDGQRLMELMDEHNINVMQATPATWRMLLGFGWEGKGDLKALCGGEALPPDLVGSLLPKVGELWNMYGPTETTIWSACKRIEDAAELITIGKPIANTQLYILNDALQLQPVGVPGELYIGGDGVAEGYHNRAELTAERFIEHPEFGRIYCTGDRARVMGQGEVQHLGRLDDQIKLRGYRIELGEIEAALAAVAGVSQAAAVVRQLGPGDERLVAFCVCDSEQTLDASEMRQALQNRLPDYMIPQHFIALDKLPVTPNNKLDRKALANRTEEIESSLAVGSVVDAGPMTPVEATVVQIFSEQLGDIAVGPDDDFFRLGGHSLTATWVIHTVEQRCNVRIGLRAFFTHPTARSVARLVSEQGGQADAEVLAGTLERLDPATPASLSPSQHRMWLVSQLFPDATFYNLPSTFRLRGELDVKVLQDSFQLLIDRQPALRTRFVVEENSVLQLIGEVSEAPALELVDMTGESDPVTTVLDWVKRQIATPFDLEAEWPYRCRLFRLGDNDHALYFMPHHIVFDGWSFDVFYGELNTIYQARMSGVEPVLPVHAYEYRDYCHWKNEANSGAAGQAMVDRWRERLSPMPDMLEIPRDFVPDPEADPAKLSALPIRIEADEMTVLRAACEREGITPFMMILAAYAYTLARWTSTSELVIGTPMSGRDAPGSRDLVGLFVGALPLKIGIGGQASVRDLFEEVKRVCMEAFDDPDVPIEELVRELKLTRHVDRNPIFQVFFAFQDTRERESNLGDMPLEPINPGEDSTETDLEFWVLDSPSGLKGAFHYRRAYFDPRHMEGFRDAFLETLKNMALSSAEPLLKLGQPTVTDTECYRELNTTDYAFAQHDFLSLVSGSGAEPDSLAVVSGAERLSYETLGQRVDQLASYLATEHGVGPGSIVGLYLLREADLLTAMLAVAKTGAAYLPLDPGFPEARLAFMVEDTDAQLVICNTDLPESMGRTQVDLRTDWPQIEAAAATDGFTSKADPDGVAYIIYTSGSTGKPKGVAVGHRALANFLQTMAQQPGVAGGDRLLAVTTLSFDISMLELLLPLTVAATVVVATQEESGDGQRLMELMDEHNINVMQATPATWRMLLGFGWEGKGDLKALCGGEALPPDLVGSLLPQVGELWNMYGPTETTIWSACKRIEDAAELITIGKPIANTQLYILNDALQLQPVGVPGELYIGGDGVAEGYHNRAELTAERFIEHPEFGRIYCTGDRARVMGQGEVQHLGRLDDQIKLRGYRIELGEIEAALAAVAGVSQAAARIIEVGQGDARLIGYFVPESDSNASIASIRGDLRKRLPNYMVPTNLIELETFPLTPNGKVDRKALPSLESLSAAADQKAPLESEAQKQMASIWADLIGVTHIGPDDNFFQLGGHSLLVIKAIKIAAEQFDTVLRPKTLIMDNLREVTRCAGGLLTKDKSPEAMPEDSLAKKDSGREKNASGLLARFMKKGG